MHLDSSCKLPLVLVIAYKILQVKSAWNFFVWQSVLVELWQID